MLKPAIVRFLAKINVVETGCWEWTAYLNQYGYSKFQLNGKIITAHRFIYEYYYGTICPDLTIDHLCRNRKCVNVNHLEQVTNRLNIQRGIKYNTIKTHCKHGHKFNKTNTRIYKGFRVCRACEKINRQLWVKNNQELYHRLARQRSQRYRDEIKNQV